MENSDSPIPPEVISEAPQAVAPRPWGFWATVGLSVVVIVATLTVQVLVLIGYIAVRTAQNPHVDLNNLAPDAGSNGLLLSVATWAALPVCLGLTVLFARLRRGWTVREYLALNCVPSRAILGGLGLLIVFVSASDGLTWLLGRPIVPDFMKSAYRTAYYVPLLWATLLVAAPLMEETLFRGFMIRGIDRSRLGAAGAIIIASAAWSLMHVQYDAYGMSQVFLMGILLGAARLRTQSLYPPLAMHSLANLIATIELIVYNLLSGGGQ
jgi:membrane protease YdiL (CAAX protease family)